MKDKVIYLDNCATTKIDESALKIMEKYYLEDYGNPSSMHKMGIKVERDINQVRKLFGDILKVPKDTIFFNSGGTEGNNMAITLGIQKNKHKGNKIITTKSEHPSVMGVFKYYESLGYNVIYLNVDNKGHIDQRELYDNLDKETIFVSIMKVNNEIGTIQDLSEVNQVIKRTNPHCIIHCDCVQALGKIILNPIVEGIDIMTFSAHKLHGPKGVGAIYINKDIRMNSYNFGGGQEKGLRSGTENVPGIIGMGEALRKNNENYTQYNKHLKELKKYCVNRLYNEINDIHFNGDMKNSAPHILNFSIKNTKGEVLLHILEDKNIYVSTGSACTSKKKTQSYVLKSIGLHSEYIEGSLRIGFSIYNTLEEIDTFVDTLKKSVNFLNRYTRRK